MRGARHGSTACMSCSINNPPDFMAVGVTAQDTTPFEAPVQFAAVDGFELTGTFFWGPCEIASRHAALINCGGGISATRYHNFARYLATAGLPVLTYDYRGIGASRPARLRKFAANVYDWSEYDCAGPISWLRARCPEAELVGIAHSVGALLFGGAVSATELSRFLFICAHTGYYRDYHPRYRVPMALLWHYFMPFVSHAWGYFPSRLFGLGEDIPRGVARQWAARKTADLRPEATDVDASRGRAMLGRFPEVAGSALVLSFSDDAFATTLGTRRLLSLYPRLRANEVVIRPADVGLSKIGHFGFFRRSSAGALWPRVLPFLSGPTAVEAKGDCRTGLSIRE